MGVIFGTAMGDILGTVSGFFFSVSVSVFWNALRGGVLRPGGPLFSERRVAAWSGLCWSGLCCRVMVCARRTEKVLVRMPDGYKYNQNSS
jgi:hypothetical protein